MTAVLTVITAFPHHLTKQSLATTSPNRLCFNGISDNLTVSKRWKGKIIVQTKGDLGSLIYKLRDTVLQEEVHVIHKLIKDK